MSLKPFLIIILIVSGCSYIPFNKKNIETNTITDTIKESDIYSEDFTKYLIANGFNKDELPFKKWGLTELIYSQEYFNPELKTAKMQWEMVKTDEVIAKLYPQSSLGFEIGRETTNKEFPLILTTGRLLEHWHTGSMTRRSIVLDEIEPTPEVHISPSQLKNIGVNPGDIVNVKTRRG